MKSLCAWCGSTLAEGLDKSVSEGFCSSCRAGFGAVSGGADFQEFIDAFPFPVLVLNELLQPVAVNKNGAFLRTNVSKQSTIGQVMGCINSKLPEGCGNTAHCSSCVLRKSVTETNETGRPIVKVPATLNKISGESSLLVSTLKTDGSTVIMKLEHAGHKS
jgi:hypothetical protein